MTDTKYILNDKGEPVPESDLMKWAAWFGKVECRRVAVDQIGEVEISTVFLGLDHNFGEGPPILWETMTFGGANDQDCDRCSGSREQAEAMHNRMVEKVRGQQQ